MAEPHSTLDSAAEARPPTGGPSPTQPRRSQIAGALRRHNATRHLCAATYLDDNYCDELINKIDAQRRRWTAPSYGFDLVTVLRHARRAWWLTLSQSILILAGTAAVALVAPVASVVFGLTMVILWLLRLRLRIFGDYWKSLFRPNPPEFYQQLKNRRKLISLGIFLVCALAIVGYLAAVAKYGARATSALLRGVPGAATMLLGLAILAVIIALVRCRALSALSDIPLQGIPTGRLSSIDLEQHHTVTVYSGPMPFVGSGYPLSTWSFAQRMVQPPKNGSSTIEDALSALASAARGSDLNAQPEYKREFDELPFRAIDLIRHLEERLRALRDETNPELRLPGLKVRHRVFVPGIESEWIPAPDDNGVVARAIANPSLPLRHYLACEISSWGGEIYTTVYMHVSLQGRSLFLEFSTYALPPTRSEYHIFDEEGKTGFGFAVTSILGALWRLPEAVGQIPRDLARAVRYVAATVVGMTGRDRAQERGLDIGAEVSARELATDLQHQDWFQYRDVMKHWKIIERRMLATVLDFLHSRGVDVTEYRQRAIAVLNRGVINVGSGSVDVSGVIGDNSSVQVSGSGARD